MSNKILVFLLPFLLSANLAQALTCKSGDSACATNSAAECEKLGYAKADVTGCSHYLYCPFDTAYKTCSSTSSVATADCTSGYPKSVDSCGSTGAKGWSLGNKDANGCGKCTKKSCSSGASENATGILFNHLTGADLTQSAYAIFTPNGEYTGNTRCGTFTLNTRIICSEYIDDKRACGYGLDYDRSYDDIFDACQNGGDAESDCSSLNDCIRDVNNLWNRQYDVNYCFECGYSSDDGLACW